MEEWWRSLNESKNLFNQFFEDMKKISFNVILPRYPDDQMTPAI
jgi:hypothetical protein